MSLLPKKLCVYYGYPSLVNGSNGVVSLAVNVFKDYDLLVLGATLEQTTHPDHNKTQSIITHSLMVNTAVFGEIDSTIALNQFKNKVDLWKNMGVKGIFCNKMGYDYNLTRQKQNQILDYIHSKALIAFVNVWIPEDIFSNAVNSINNPTGLSSTINSSDWYLAQSYQIINGSYQSEMDWKARADKLANYKQQTGVKIACITTTNNSQFYQSKMDYAYYSTILYGFDSFGYGEYNYSATSNLIPFRYRKIFYGTRFVNNIENTDSTYQRATNIGIHLDTANHIATTALI